MNSWDRRRAIGRRALGLALGLVWLAPADLPVGALLGAGGVAAQAALPVDIEVGGSRQVLTGDNDAWEDYWIRATVRPAPGTYAYGGVRHTVRFGEEDQQLEAGLGLPVAEGWRLRLDGTWSPTQRVLPIWGLSGRLTHRLSPRWSVYGGGGRQVWEAAAVNRQHAGVTHHVGPFEAGYTLHLHQLDPGGSGLRHALHGGWSYDARGSHLRLVVGAGRDAAMVGPGDVRSLQEEFAGIWGTHWLDDRTGVGYNFGVHRHGDFFTRSTTSVGIRRRL
jgi:YaiO family outer membrane protein